MKAKSISIVLLLFLFSVVTLPSAVLAQDDAVGDIDIMSGDQAYKSYLAAPEGEGTYPAIVLIHSFRGLEEGYRTMTDALAAEGFVVLAVGWQTFQQDVPDATMQQLLEDSIAYLSGRGDVDAERLGLTGFCAGGRHTMLFLPQISGFKAGVAWYGFPNNGDPAPSSFVEQLNAPMLIIHGTEDQPSPIADIYEYATALQQAGKTFELKVYSGEPHGFMLEGGQLRTDDVAQDAYNEMVDFFTRKLAAPAS
jgi:carboxymethylenebutenolidase